MQWIPNDENKRRDEAFAEFIGGVAFVIYEEDRGWPKEVWDAAWSAKREWVGLTAKDLSQIPPSAFEGAIWADAKLREKNT